MLQMDLTVLETKLYHVESTEEEIKEFSLIKKFQHFKLLISIEKFLSESKTHF